MNRLNTITLRWARHRLRANWINYVVDFLEEKYGDKDRPTLLEVVRYLWLMEKDGDAAYQVLQARLPVAMRKAWLDECADGDERADRENRNSTLALKRIDYKYARMMGE